MFDVNKMGTIEITHKNDKERKEFIMDCVFIGVALSLLQVGLYEDTYGDSIQLHKNKQRKVLTKLKKQFEILNNYKFKIYGSLSKRDLFTIQHKTKESGTAFINHVSTSDRELNLQHLCVCILDQALSDFRKKFGLYPILDVFHDEKNIVTNIFDVVCDAGILSYYETDIARLFINNVKY